MKIRVGFSTTNMWFSRLIRWTLGTKVSHSYIRFYDPFLEMNLIVHADLPGVVIEDAVEFDKVTTVIEEYEIEDERLRFILAKNLKLLRRKYDWWNILGWAWVIAFKRWIKKKMRNPVEDPKKLICVQYCLRFLAPLVNVPAEDLNPKSFREWMNDVHEEYGWKKFTYIE